MKFTAFLEVVLLFVIIFLFNYLADSKELLYSDYTINIYLYALVVVALFYGFFASLLFYVLYFGIQYFIFKEVNIFMLSHYFIFLSIFSEFTYYWNKKIEKLKEHK